MANTFPTLATGSMVVHGALLANSLMKHPATLTSAWGTRVIRFLGDQEQSWTVHQKLFSAQLQYTRIYGYDVARVQDFWRQMTGRFVDDALLNTFSMVILGLTYSYMVFDTDEFAVQEDQNSPVFQAAE